MKNFVVQFLLLLTASSLSAQLYQPWKGKKAAVVITYDDAINEHLDHAIPVLDSLGIKATFYITAFSRSMQKRMDEWKRLAVHGHELGNHTLFHPCNGGSGREWVTQEIDLRNYSLKQIENEIRMTNLFLHALDGKTKRTFAFTCGDRIVADSLFINGMKKDFIAARAVRNEMHKINDVDLYNVDCYLVNNHSFEQMKEWVDQAIQSNSLLVILFHGVGGGNSLDVSIENHKKILSYIKQNEKDIYSAPMLEVAEHIQDWQQRYKQSKVLQQATLVDYNDMLGKLNIKSTRPGPSGNPAASNAANTKESKAITYTSLPDPLVLKNGKKVTDAKTWWTKRRPEIAEDFEKEVYGCIPKNVPKVIWEIVRSIDTVYGHQKAITKYLIGHVDNSIYPQIKVEIQLSVTVPFNRKNPVPFIIEFGYQIPSGYQLPTVSDTLAAKSWQEQLLERGYGFAILIPTSYQADNGAGLTQGIIGLCNKGQHRKPDDWGTLRAWAWGASRAIDYVETDTNIDAKKIVIEGLSRYGKAAVVAMAFEPRIAMGFIGSSGAGGTKILRRVYGEQVENLVSSAEYHWFAGNFIKYAADPLTQNDLPVDAHELLALCAPRPVFISSGSPKVEGNWVDAKGMFLAGAYAGIVYQLFGKKGLGTMVYPGEETLLAGGDIAWRQHNGGHTVGPNWPYFLDFADRYFQ